MFYKDEYYRVYSIVLSAMKKGDLLAIHALVFGTKIACEQSSWTPIIMSIFGSHHRTLGV